MMQCQNEKITIIRACLSFVIVSLLFGVIGIVVWGPRIFDYRGYLYNDAGHLLYSYSENLKFHFGDYLPWAKHVHRPIGRDAITLLLRLFGENHVLTLSALLFIHIINSLFCWGVLKLLKLQWWICNTAAVFFLVSVNAFLPIYWPAAIFDLLSVTFVMLSVCSLIIAFSLNSKWRVLGLGLNLIFFIFAAKTKESSLMLVVPLSFLYFALVMKERPIISGFMKLLKEQTRQALKNLIYLFSTAEWLWCLCFVLVCFCLVMNVTSDFNANHQGVVHPAYARSYSFNVIFTSLGLYIANYFYIVNSPAPLSPEVACLILCIVIAITIYLRNFLMMLGIVWWFAFLIVLSTMVNQYHAPHYPYPATIGGAFFLAGLISEFVSLVSNRQGDKLSNKPICNMIAPFFCFCLTCGNVYLSYEWVRYDTLPNWAAGFHKLSMQMYDSLKQVIPNPVPHSEFIFVTNASTFLDQNPTTVMRAIYRDFTLNGHVSKTLEEGKDYFAKSNATTRYLLVWLDNHYKLVDG